MRRYDAILVRTYLFEERLQVAAMSHLDGLHASLKVDVNAVAHLKAQHLKYPFACDALNNEKGKETNHCSPAVKSLCVGVPAIACRLKDGLRSWLCCRGRRLWKNDTVWCI